jgi:hypothetical protein
MESKQISFEASLGRRERWFFYALGCGLFLGMPLFMGIVFSLAFETLEPLVLPTPFILGFMLVLLFRPTGYLLDSKFIHVVRPVGSKKFPIGEVNEIRSGTEDPSGLTIGLARATGFYGVFGSFWNREWGKFYVYITDATKSLQVMFKDGRRLFISPTNKTEFLEALKAAASLT